MAGFEIFKRWIGLDKQRLSYVIVVVRPPWSIDKIKEISSYWASDAHELFDSLKEPTARQAILKDMNWTGDMFEKAVQVTDIQFFKHFPLIGFLMNKDKIGELRRLPNIEYVHEVPEDYGYDYLNIIKGLHWVGEPVWLSPDGTCGKSKKIDAVNMSLQPLEPYPFHEKEPMNVATRLLTEKGITVVVAAGNFGDRGDNTLNPWSVAPWVISVGAAYPDGKRLWEKSSRGIAGDPLYHPDVVASGVDSVSARSPEGIYDAVDPEGKYAILSGTSFATAKVSGIVALCVEFITDQLATSPSVPEWQYTLKSQFNARVCPIIPSPDVIKRMIEDMAVEMPMYETHEVGAGFIDRDIAVKYFEDFKFSNFIKVFASAEGGE
ncbi:MAG: hypothetical protein A7316_07090 [Candidatus Altiarchaeales archaeon WOR_SM1_86-2]|nr:MAG: hypothetical protein A7315_05500 [Candidatus Altiarchaeales archaeon WOR_SM1_79]ODS38801.1 MAG: hypothetical protein A7316_07090 [Candidatus Altiarchaeales archaeon WOR_SM1_86-2]